MEKILQKTSAMNAPSNPALPRRTYTAPSLTIVQFHTEVGSILSNYSVKTWGSDWASAGSTTDGTETYEVATDQGTGFFN